MEGPFTISHLEHHVIEPVKPPSNAYPTGVNRDGSRPLSTPGCPYNSYRACDFHQ